MKNAQDRQPDNNMEQDLWRQFESTGSVQQYLLYRQAHNAAGEERINAQYSDGAGGQGNQGGRI